MALNYYSRMRFISNLLPLLQVATSNPPHFSRTLSILGAGDEGKVNFDDLELKNTFSPIRCAAHTIVMNDFMTEEFSKRQPGTTFAHSYPSVVITGITRELPTWARVPMKVFLYPIMKAVGIIVSAEETGARQLFIATSGLYPPAKPFENAQFASGVQVPKGLTPILGANGIAGSGAYIVNWNNERAGNQKLLKEYRDKDSGATFWEHTMSILKRAEKINEGRKT
jgi:hypothetical protein